MGVIVKKKVVKTPTKQWSLKRFLESKFFKLSITDVKLRSCYSHANVTIECLLPDSQAQFLFRKLSDVMIKARKAK